MATGGSEERRYLIGVDDTDNHESRGTGYRARCLGARLAAEGLGRVDGITRHQLFVDPRIPYTSHNSSLCLGLVSSPQRIGAVTARCREFLVADSAPGSDAGLCVVAADAVSDALCAFGRRAKEEVVTRDEAHRLADACSACLEGLTGDGGGVIGSLAGVGLRASGCDGRFVWLEGVRELGGVLTASQLFARTAIDDIRTLDGLDVADGATICVEPWPRPVMIDGRAVLLVQRREDPHAAHDWQLAPREVIRQY